MISLGEMPPNATQHLQPPYSCSTPAPVGFFAPRSQPQLTIAVNESNVGRIFYGYEFLRALTLCLVNLLPEHERLKSKSARTPPWEGLVLSAKPTSSPIRPPNRPIAETQALQILHKILPTAPNTALLAGLVPEWLAKYPFPCALPENGSRRDLVLKYFTVWHTDDPLMAYVLGFIQTFPDGQHALKKAGLAASHDYLDDDTDDEYEEWDEYDHVIEFGDFDGDIPMHGGEDTAGTVSESGRRRVRRRRYHVDSAEEQAMRRRRREAMVFSEGGGPLGQDNIILRNEDVRSPVGREQGDGEGEVEEQLSRLQEEVDREFEEAPILNDQQMLEALR